MVLFGGDAVRVVVLFVRLNNRNYVEVHMNWLFLLSWVTKIYVLRNLARQGTKYSSEEYDGGELI